MSAPRPHSLLRTRDQWIRASHSDTAWNSEDAAVELASDADVLARGPLEPAPELGGGLAFDAACRLYRSRPDAGRVDRSHWDATTSAGEAMDLFSAQPPPAAAGDFAPLPGAAGTGALNAPRGLAIDADDRLFVAETGAARILVVDLWSGRVLRTVRVRADDGGTAAPLDLACSGTRVWAVLDRAPWLASLEARRGPWAQTLVRPPGLPSGARPRRLTVHGPGRPLVLFRDGADRGFVCAPDPARIVAEIDRASDIELVSPTRLVVARGVGEPFEQLELLGGADVERGRPLRARGYDGLGIARAPDGRIAFGAGDAVRHALPARLRYARRGRVVSYRLDSGQLQNRWGRLFLDACVPAGTGLRVHCLTADDESVDARLPWMPPANVDADVGRPDLTPPLPPAALVPGDGGIVRTLRRRSNGRELPWVRFEPSDRFETYEAPIDAPAGRYLWVAIELSGTTRATPSVRALRAEHESHDLVRRLPRTYSREPAVESFLRRYLAILEGVVFDLDGRGERRAALLDPRSTPAELLPWLAGFLGLVLDERWPLAARRTLVAEAADLFRLRGTVASLERMLEIYLGRRPLIVEHFKLRGLGGVLVGGEESSAFAGAIVGAGLRVGGAVGAADEAPLAGSEDDAFTTHAHRFTVVIPQLLAGEQLATVGDTLERHRPAHTVFEVCAVGSGMRVGRGLHLGLLSTVGRTAGWESLQLGASALGRGATVGRPVPGMRVGESSLYRPGGGGVGAPCGSDPGPPAAGAWVA